ncbi:PAAR domain-containing protein [Aquimarina longa]|uniref:PAAR domain-containing protein n=1 Tax=Aquimarina longa TaxID=1080221 RepID=UPI000780397D|nr:PAAR domain-containing protein [Aquimarina longa]
MQQLLNLTNVIMAKPILTVQDFYTNPQMQGGISPAIAVGSTSMFIDKKPVLTANDSIVPIPDQALALPNGVFHHGNPVIVLNDATKNGGTFPAPNRLSTVAL